MAALLEKEVPIASPAGQQDSGRRLPLFDDTTELGRDLAAVDWSATPLGPVDQWPASLRNTVSMMVSSRFAMWMAWGPDLTFFCNDAYRRDTLGTKYPWALGKPARFVWAEIWSDVGPRIESVLQTGVATWDVSLPLYLERSGYREETYHTFSYSPLIDDAGAIGGMLCVVSEDTPKVIGERRMATLRDLGAELARAATEEEVLVAAQRQIGTDPHDLPFALTYLFDDTGAATLMWRVGLTARHPAAPAFIAASASAPWPARRLAEGETCLLSDLAARFNDLPHDVEHDPPTSALVVPLARPNYRRPYGFLVVGLNPNRPIDTDYRGFIDLLAGQVAAAITRARAFEAERRQVAELAELDRAKTTFFTNVSHELRTPLTLLLGPATDALADTDHPLHGVQRRRLDVITRNAERLLKLVNTLLDFSRLESGRVAPQFELLDLSTYTTDLVSMFESAVRRAGLTLTISCTPLQRQVYVDREMWAKIVLNLVSNALKATFEGGIEVRLDEVDGAAQLTVRDTGIGIPAEEQRRLFERFHRVSGAALRSHEGSGIGLALVAELAQLHSGTVTVASEVGAGSTFCVRIPAGADHLPADDLVTEVIQLPIAAAHGASYVSEAARWLDADADVMVGAPDRDPTTGELRILHEGRRRVLVVDDNADMRSYIGALLAEDYYVVTAADGVAALEEASARPPDLVLTDVMMPKLDGFGLLAALRGNPATAHIPVVMLSARSGDEATVEGLEAGADDYLVKPFTARELVARVRSNLELDRVRRMADNLQRSRALLDHAETLAHVGSWELDLRTNRVHGSAEFYRIFGLDPGDLDNGGFERVLAQLDPRDHEAGRAALAAAMDTGAPIELELRLAVDGERILRIHGVSDLDETGAPTILRGSAQDITEQRRVDQVLAAARSAAEVAAREHAIAEELQRSLLPAPISSIELDLATYYRAGVEGTQVGGDWYDVFELSGGCLAVSLGDVMGRGVKAAAVMGQLRATTRAYARLDLSPGEVIRQLDAAVRDLGIDTIVTCVYAVYDPVNHSLAYANAGHLPPLVALPGEPVRRLNIGNPPLGVGIEHGVTETIELPAGSRLVLYTDGLVEHRGADLDVGIDRLAQWVEATRSRATVDPAELVAGLLPDGPDDDVAVLIATVPQLRRHFRQLVGAGSAPVAEARHATIAALTKWGISQASIDDAALIVSELVTNGLLHAGGPVELVLAQDDRGVVIEVTDAAGGVPTLRPLTNTEDGGRGLHIVAALAVTWGVRASGAGKCVYAVLRP